MCTDALLTSKSSLDLREDKFVPEGSHSATSQVPSVKSCFLGCIGCLEQLSADGIAVSDGGIHTIIDSVEQPWHRHKHVGRQLLYVIQQLQDIAPVQQNTCLRRLLAKCPTWSRAQGPYHVMDAHTLPGCAAGQACVHAHDSANPLSCDAQDTAA